MHNEAVALEQAGQLQKAHDLYLATLELQPNHQTWFSLGKVCSSMGDKSQAIAHYNQAIALKPDYAMAYNNKAFAHYSLEEFALAGESISKAVTLEPENGLFHATRAEILFAMGDEEGFFEALKASTLLGIDPGILDRRIAEKYKDSERYEAVLAECKQILFRRSIGLVFSDKKSEVTAFPDLQNCLSNGEGFGKSLMPFLSFDGGLSNEKWSGIPFSFILGDDSRLDFKLVDGKYELMDLAAVSKMDEGDWEEVTDGVEDIAGEYSFMKALQMDEGEEPDATLNVYKPVWCQQDETPLGPDQNPMEFIAELNHDYLFGTLYLFYSPHFKLVTQIFQCT